MQPSIADPTDYFRRDQENGVTPPDLSKTCTFAEHIVHARGRRTQFTSITLHPHKCRDMGEATYWLRRSEVDHDGHRVVEHAELLAALEDAARDGEKADRIRAIQAARYARRRSEGLIDWRFDTTGIARKDLISFARERIAPYFVKV